MAALAPTWAAARLGLDGDAVWTRVVGVCLAVFAVSVAGIAVLSDARRRRGALGVTGVDLAWVVATVVVIATADVSALGVVIAVVMGAGVLGFAVLQFVFARRPVA